MSIEVKGITKVYGTQKAVDAISFKVDKGEIVGFLGPNGAGKSTTMKIVTGYLYADEGSVSVCGLDVSTQSLQARKKIGYLPESNALYHDMYVREYLDFICNIYSIRNKQSTIANVVERVGLTSEANKKIGQLSKGYKQRTGLAAALIHDPEVLILDEPTSGLDPNQIIEIREIIHQLGKEKTVLLSSHIMQEVQAVCDRIIIINKGTIVADNQLSELQQERCDALIVTFEETLESSWIEGLKGIDTACKIAGHQWKLMGNDLSVIRKQVMQLALDKNLNILSMQENKESLEDIFRSLTMSK